MAPRGGASRQRDGPLPSPLPAAAAAGPSTATRAEHAEQSARAKHAARACPATAPARRCPLPLLPDREPVHRRPPRREPEPLVEPVRSAATPWPRAAPSTTTSSTRPRGPEASGSSTRVRVPTTLPPDRATSTVPVSQPTIRSTVSRPNGRRDEDSCGSRRPNAATNLRARGPYDVNFDPDLDAHAAELVDAPESGRIANLSNNLGCDSRRPSAHCAIFVQSSCGLDSAVLRSLASCWTIHRSTRGTPRVGRHAETS